jgi:hypothetical protein
MRRTHIIQDLFGLSGRLSIGGFFAVLSLDFGIFWAMAFAGNTIRVLAHAGPVHVFGTILMLSSFLEAAWAMISLIVRISNSIAYLSWRKKHGLPHGQQTELSYDTERSSAIYQPSSRRPVAVSANIPRSEGNYFNSHSRTSQPIGMPSQIDDGSIRLLKATGRQRISLFICRYFATIFAIFIVVSGGTDFDVALIVIPMGFIIDVLRRYWAPEFRMSSLQREMSLKRAQDDPKYRGECKSKESRYKIVYWIWWISFFVILFFPSVRIFSTNSTWPKLYPFLEFKYLLRAYGLASRAGLAFNVLSVSWIFMICATIAEISGCGFYYLHRNPLRNKAGLLSPHRFPKNFLWLAFFCFFVTYTLPGFNELFTTGVTLRGAPIGAGIPLPDFLFYRSIFFGAFGTVCAAGVIRAIYAYFLFQISRTADQPLSG